MEKPSFKAALKFWLKLGFISFGGPAGQIAIMHEYLVEKKKWISDSRFLHALNYCMILPGPEAQQLAIYTGWLLNGFYGGLAAGVLFVLPSMFILLALSLIYVSFGNLPWIYAMFNGLKPAVVAIVILAIIKIGKRSLVRPFHYFIAAAAFVSIYFLNISFPIIILCSILIAFVIQKIFPQFFQQNKQVAEKINADENEYYINQNKISPEIRFIPQRFIKQLVAGILLWLIPFLLFYFFNNEFSFWKLITLFFTKAALVTFGGAYAVLPYVAQVSVEQYHWLSKLQMIDGLALGETTPGPLIMVLSFVGFLAGYHHYSGSLLMGSIALITTTFYTFLPCFIFIFIGAPIIERTHQNKKIKNILSVVTAAVVGVILNLTVYLGKAVIFLNQFSLQSVNYIMLSWIVISFFTMYKFKIGMILWIGISAVFGLVYYFISNR